jgi:hypothetical protein
LVHHFHHFPNIKHVEKTPYVWKTIWNFERSSFPYFDPKVIPLVSMFSGMPIWPTNPLGSPSMDRLPIFFHSCSGLWPHT